MVLNSFSEDCFTSAMIMQVLFRDDEEGRKRITRRHRGRLEHNHSINTDFPSLDFVRLGSLYAFFTSWMRMKFSLSFFIPLCIGPCSCHFTNNGSMASHWSCHLRRIHPFFLNCIGSTRADSTMFWLAYSKRNQDFLICHKYNSERSERSSSIKPLH
jgi:hypothetical protein